MREELPKNWGQEDGSFIDDGGAAGHRQNLEVDEVYNRRSWYKTLELYEVTNKGLCIKARLKKKDRPSDQESKDGKVC